MFLAAEAAVAAEPTVTVVKAPGKLDGMKVVRDKETGKLRAATPEEIAELNKATSGYAPNAVILNRPVTTLVTRPDGGQTIRRSADDLDSLKASRSSDGKLTVHHGDKPAAQPLPKE
jgi:hypothetical protein